MVLTMSHPHLASADMLNRSIRATGRRSTAVWALVLGVLGLVASACNPAPADIVLADDQTANVDGTTVEIEFYRNLTHECGLSGNYTFMVINPPSNPNGSAPLWTYLHGGGSGYFDTQGTYQAISSQDENTWNHEEDFAKLQDIVLTRVLNANGQLEDQTIVRRIQEGYRVLVVSMCDHDAYSGLGTPYPNNPNPGAEVNGLEATMAAIDYTTANYPTTHVWAHGASAGSYGAWALASQYSLKGTPLTGVVGDSAIHTPNSQPMVDEYLAAGALPWDATFDPQQMADKIGVYGDRFGPLTPEAQIANGFSDVPALFIAGRNDPFCGSTLAPTPAASAAGLNNCEYLYDGLAQVIDTQPNSPHQLHIVNAGHVPTLDPKPAVNTIVDNFIDGVLAANPPNFGS